MSIRFCLGLSFVVSGLVCFSFSVSNLSAAICDPICDNTICVRDGGGSCWGATKSSCVVNLRSRHITTREPDGQCVPRNNQVMSAGPCDDCNPDCPAIALVEASSCSSCDYAAYQTFPLRECSVQSNN